MNNLHIEKTDCTPEINFDAKKHVLTFKGKSYPENTFEFYEPVEKWVEEYFQTVKDEKVIINLDISYLNSGSIKVYYDIFDTLEEVQEEGLDVVVQWYHESGDFASIENGEDFIEDYETLNITLVEK